jgi:hypothetical protein
MNFMRHVNNQKIRILLSFWFIAGLAFAQEKGPMQILKIAGVPSAPDKILEFVQKGSPATINIKAINEQSIPATQIAISGIQELTRHRYQPAIPILIQTAKGDFTPGQKSLVDYDCESVSPSQRDEKRSQLSDFLRFNALNALGLLGNPEVLPILQEIFRNSSPSLFKINAALGMACLDNGEGIEYLVRQVESNSRYLGQEAAVALSFITGADFDFGPYTPISRRERTVKSIKKWWKENQQIFRPNGKEILERRLNIQTLPPSEIRSIRDIVRAAGNYGDLDNRMKSLDAREKLAGLGNSILPELKTMCLDVEDDLNIRMEALRRYARLADWNDAKEVLKKGKKDKNPEIRDLCKNLLKNPPLR